ncbi:hypothetical protein [Sphingorhabdus sp.]|uniref:hypothetical protein n=1 Tax=Sphingorhabdus sp. TaxID=1902408 RepID=UPI0035B2A305|nr:hypothetical protein [Sphingomonadaceae bacterium]
MSLTSYRAAPSRATNEATSLSPGSHFCFPFREWRNGGGLLHPASTMDQLQTTDPEKKKGDNRMYPVPPF